jgi:hypothetical protein
MPGGTNVTVGVKLSPPSFALIKSKTVSVLVTLKSNNKRPTNGLNVFITAVRPLTAPIKGLLAPSYKKKLSQLPAGRSASTGAMPFAAPLESVVLGDGS